jgi:HicA toxin of bacterial toxin-antitoxin,
LLRPSDFTWQELISLLTGFGYALARTGKTGGSRVKFIHKTLPPIILHKPHPTLVLKRYQLEQIEETLKGEGLL